MPKIIVDPDLCKACRMCISACPKGIVELSPEINRFGNRVVRQKPDSICAGCKLCGMLCPDSAISVYREEAGR